VPGGVPGLFGMPSAAGVPPRGAPSARSHAIMQGSRGTRCAAAPAS